MLPTTLFATLITLSNAFDPFKPFQHKWFSHDSYSFDDEKVDLKTGGKHQTVYDQLKGKAEFKMFFDAIEQSGQKGLRNELEDEDAELTVFAPNNAAFNRIQHRIPNFKPSKGELEKIIKYHILKEKYPSRKLYDGQLLKSTLRLDTLRGEHQYIRVAQFHGESYLNFWIKVETADIQASNGVVHEISEVLIPPHNALDTLGLLPFKFSTFTSAVQFTGLAEELRSSPGITVFAPDNAAFKKLGCNLYELFAPHQRETLKKILQYHIVTSLEYTPGIEGEQRLKTAEGKELVCKKVEEKGLKKEVLVLNQVATTWLEDIPVANGVIQAIDEVLIPEDMNIKSCESQM